MQEIVNFLVENPEIVEKVVNGEASLLGVKNVDEVLGLVEGLLGTDRITNMYWW
ncbi:MULTISPECIES: competence pheromone ComX [Metabacillus]|uniref:competence pheromone ComX n=1 Tax=Metabacillus TaxID=2675233 RepID=UPI0009D67F1C|nr:MULTISPECIES: competence pheromone ComX [Metabacillus]MDX8290262.1 competence pheromone ComX [Metabacillus indicus]